MKVDYRRLAENYARHRGPQSGVLERILATAAVSAASDVLEIGCGTGNYIGAVAETTQCCAWGIDPSESMLARARDRLVNVSTRLGRAECLPFADNAFDLVFSVDVIHHVEDQPAAFREAFRVLRRGGRICTVTDSEEIIRCREPLSVYFPETVEVDLRRYPPIAALKEMMLRSGFAGMLEQMVKSRRELTDGAVYRARSFSCLHLISDEAFQEGLARLEAALTRGPVPAVSGYLLLWGTRP